MKYANENSITQLATDLLTKVKEVANDKVDKVLASKTYQNIIATSNTQALGTFYFLKITPNAFRTPWRVKVRYIAKINDSMTNANKDLFHGDFQFEVVCSGTSVLRYEAWNSIHSISYRPVYYHTLYRASQVGLESGYPHYLGTAIYSSTSPTTTTLKRDFEVEVLEAENCTIELLDEMILQSTFYSATNYTGISNYNAYSVGNFHTGDANNIDRLIYASYQPKASDVSLYGTQLVLSADGENFHSITNQRSTSLTASTKAVNQYAFKPEHIFYYSSTTTMAAGNRVAASTIYESLPFDFRYSYKGSALTAHKPVYLVATYNDGDDTFTPIESDWIVQDLPTEASEYCYVLLGYAYTTTSIYLKPTHPVYTYYNGSFQEVADAKLKKMQSDIDAQNYVSEKYMTEYLQEIMSSVGEEMANTYATKEEMQNALTTVQTMIENAIGGIENGAY